MNTLKLLLLGIFATMGLTACGGDSKDQPEVNTDNKITLDCTVSTDFDANEASFNIAVASPFEWDATCSADWVNLTKKGTLEKQGTISVEIKKNSNRQSRTAEIVVRNARNGQASLTVKQAGKEPEPVDPTIQVPEGYELVWNDEFDSGSELNRDKWTHEVQGAGWVNNELQHYVNGSYDGIRVTEVSDGVLTITASKTAGRVISGRVYANVDTGWKYGIFEARIKLPKGKGTWPAFWMMPANNDWGSTPWPLCGEIDIMEEVGTNANYTSSSIHCDAYNHTKGTQKTAERFTADAEGEFHVYRLEWTEESIRTFVDGHALLTFYNDKTGNVRTWPFNKPFYVILNLAWGGDWGGMNGVDESALPAKMEVDYVRVFQKI